MNNGFANEHEIVRYLNKRKYRDINTFFKNILSRMFGIIDDETIIYSRICERTSKPDIVIKVKNIIKYISIKSGKSNSIHFEKINDFIEFLEKLNISKTTRETILLFHYGDGTLDGSGEKRLLFEELFPLIINRLKLANEELNNTYIVENFLDRVIFKGNENKKIEVDYIFHGNINYGILCSKEKIMKFLLRKKYNHIRTLHIGPLTLQPFLRDVNRISNNPYKREYLQVKWHYMLSDLEFIQMYYE